MNGYSGYDAKHGGDAIPVIQAHSRKQLEQVLADAAALDQINAETRARFGLPPIEKPALRSKERGAGSKAKECGQECPRSCEPSPIEKPVEPKVIKAPKIKDPKPAMKTGRRIEDRAPEAEQREIAAIIFAESARGYPRAIVQQAKVSSKRR